MAKCSNKTPTTDGENDMDAPGMKRGGKVMGAGNYKGSKGIGASHGHDEMSGKANGHKEMADMSKHGHKPVKKSKGA